MFLLECTSSSFLEGNSATFLGSIMTLAVLCFFGTVSRKKNKGDNDGSDAVTHEDIQSDDDVIIRNSNNFVQNLLSLICRRTREFFLREGERHVNRLEEDNYRILCNAIAKSKEENNPRKSEMLTLANDLQFKTAAYQTNYLGLRDKMEELYRNIIDSSEEFLSSFFYSFLFCIFVFIVDSLTCVNSWCINAVCLVSINSFIYWSFVWGYYCFTIKGRKSSSSFILYEFKAVTSIVIPLIPLAIVTLLGCFTSFSPVVITSIYIGIIFALAIIAINKLTHKKLTVFTHYFSLIHFVLLVVSVIAFCVLYNGILGKELIFGKEDARILSILFAVSSGLLFPLFVPLLRFRWEIISSLSEFKKSTATYLRENSEMKKQLEEHFNLLAMVKAVDPDASNPTP